MPTILGFVLALPFAFESRRIRSSNALFPGAFATSTSSSWGSPGTPSACYLFSPNPSRTTFLLSAWHRQRIPRPPSSLAMLSPNLRGGRVSNLLCRMPRAPFFFLRNKSRKLVHIQRRPCARTAPVDAARRGFVLPPCPRRRPRPTGQAVAGAGPDRLSLWVIGGLTRNEIILTLFDFVLRICTLFHCC